MGEATSPADIARLLAALVDTLLPGDPGWPTGAAVGVQSELAIRLVETRGEDALETLVAALRPHAAALLGGDEAARVAAVAAWEAADKELFGWVRDAVFMAYYESPVVALAINAKGHTYKLRPHATGYKLRPFDPARDAPAHSRGRYIPTESVKRIPEAQP